jgi:hypothetical protein
MTFCPAAAQAWAVMHPVIPPPMTTTGDVVLPRYEGY